MVGSTIYQTGIDKKYINAILNPVTGNMMEYRHLIEDPETREAWVKLSAN